MSQYRYQGDKHTAPEMRGAVCSAVRDSRGKCIRGRNGSMLVDFETHGRHVVLGRQLRKL
ncbi:hypothetical protein LJ737_04340 [Hymenobacter sp. 15J16-1T3B]|uniref:hypothetical protein n=1 Tax=Hymenobacter sp. 15J16-1T3B TaxID=2886941 RepID=UPI001D101F21|nr:hypothetical protein [Hymenobacter sp. 15J16-1T3B]MCC3156452.1 hypothetical protein [Hymenobacter sp. 15J16-1T3B]